MSDAAEKIYRLSSGGLCCSQIMMRLGLDYLGEEDDLLLDAAAGLCGGMHSGLCCGTLTGAACMLSMIDKAAAKAVMIPKLVKWFGETYGTAHGGINCADIIGGRPENRLNRCPGIMAATYEKCRELLAENGHLL